MAEEKKRAVKLSKEFILDLDSVYEYGVATFGALQAAGYEQEIWVLLEHLAHNWLLFSECPHMKTKSKMYRWIILESHLIIYRITIREIQVLRILNSKRSISKIRTSRNIKL